MYLYMYHNAPQWHYYYINKIHSSPSIYMYAEYGQSTHTFTLHVCTLTYNSNISVKPSHNACVHTLYIQPEFQGHMWVHTHMHEPVHTYSTYSHTHTQRKRHMHKLTNTHTHNIRSVLGETHSHEHFSGVRVTYDGLRTVPSRDGLAWRHSGRPFHLIASC